MNQETRVKNLKDLWNEFCTRANRNNRKKLLHLRKVYNDSTAPEGVRTYDLWEQNPNTGSDWAFKAQGGMAIVWVYDENHKYVGRFINGQTYTNLVQNANITTNLQ